MKQRIALLVMLACCMLALAGAPALAIDEVTPTPAAPVPDAPIDEAQALEQAYSLLFSADYAGAVEVLTELLRYFPNNAEAYSLRSYAYQALARNTLALDDMTRAIALVPWNWNFYMARGDIFVVQNDPEGALSDYLRAIDLNPRFTEGYYRLADLYSATRRTSEANWHRLMARALENYYSGRNSAALDLYNQLLEQVRGNNTLKAYGFYNRALLHYEMGSRADALRDTNSAAEFFADMHDIYLLRGTLYRDSGDLEQAGRDYYRRIELLSTSIEPVRPQGDSGVVVPMDYGRAFTLSFEAAQGEVVVLRAIDREGSGVDPLIALLDPSGSAIAGDDDSGVGTFALDALVEVVIPADGTYTLVISHANGAYTGPVDVVIERR
jgi:tetratricopeptide (TPR) repeat protein